MREKQEKQLKRVQQACNGVDPGPIEVCIFPVLVLHLSSSQLLEIAGLIPREKLKNAVGGKMGAHYAETPQMFLGKNTHILTFPIDKFETINVVAFTTDRNEWPKRPSELILKGEEQIN